MDNPTSSPLPSPDPIMKNLKWRLPPLLLNTRKRNWGIASISIIPRTKKKQDKDKPKILKLKHYNMGNNLRHNDTIKAAKATTSNGVQNLENGQETIKKLPDFGPAICSQVHPKLIPV